MTTPGVKVVRGEDVAASSPPVEIGTWFAAGLTERGPTAEAVLVKSLSQYVETFGERVSYGLLYDSLQTFFKEGGSRAYVGRVVGPTPVTATITAKNGSSEDTLKISATSVGPWGNDIDVVIVGASTTRTYEVKYLGTVVETSPSFTTNAEAVAWATGSDYVRFEDKGKGLPAAATKELASGADDRESAGETQWKNALNLFDADLGPGQVSVPGRTTATAQENTLEHAEVNNRVAILDGSDTHTAGTLTSQAATLTADENAEYGGLFAPWMVIPGLTGGTTRTVPPCAVVCGIIARNDNAGLNPNEPAAGGNGIARYATSLSQVKWSESERTTLADAGVNVLRMVYDLPRIYDYVTLANQTTDADNLPLSNARLTACIKAKCQIVGERFFGKQIGRKVPAQFGTAIEGEVLLPLYEEEALYGDTSAEAYSADIGEAVNTEESIKDGKLRAAVRVVESTFAREIEITVVKETV